LDPQQVSASPQQAIGGVYSRVFRFKSEPDPKIYTNHDIEPDAGVRAESPDAITRTIQLRPDATFQNVAPGNRHPLEGEVSSPQEQPNVHHPRVLNLFGSFWHQVS